MPTCAEEIDEAGFVGYAVLQGAWQRSDSLNEVAVRRSGFVFKKTGAPSQLVHGLGRCHVLASTLKCLARVLCNMRTIIEMPPSIKVPVVKMPLCLAQKESSVKLPADVRVHSSEFVNKPCLCQDAVKDACEDRSLQWIVLQRGRMTWISTLVAGTCMV